MAPKTDTNKQTDTAKDITPEAMRDILVRSMAIPSIGPKRLIPEAYDKLICGKKSPT